MKYYSSYIDRGDLMIEDEVNNESALKKVENSADKLVQIIKKLVNASNQVLVHGDTRICSRLPLWQTSEPMARHIGFHDYMDYMFSFNQLCHQTVQNILSLELRREQRRTSWIQTIKSVQGVLNAKNFNQTTGDVFKKYFTVAAIERVEDIAERLHSEGDNPSSERDLEQAIDVVDSEIDKLENTGKIPPEILRLLKHYLQQMRRTLDDYELLGEAGFWDIYKQTFATFAQAHVILCADKGTSEKTKEASRNSMTKLGGVLLAGVKRGRNALALGADTTTMATAILEKFA